MVKSFVVLIGVAASVPFTGTIAAISTEIPPVQAAKLPYSQTSVLHLIAHPERYYNRNIRVSGYFLSSVGLTISQDEQLRHEFAINVMADHPEPSYSECDQQWVVLEGHFRPTFDQGHRQTVGHIIADRLTIKASSDICWQRSESVDPEHVGS